MRRMNNLITLFTAMTAFFFGCFITTMLTSIDKCPQKSGVAKLEPHSELFLLVLILSAPSHVEQRQTLRETWLKLAQPLQQPYFPEDFVHLPYYDERGHLKTETVAAQANSMRNYLNWLDQISTGNGDVKKRTIKIKHFFAIGTADMNPKMRAQLQSENEKHNDLLLLPRLHDAYNNLTEKLLHAIDALVHHYDFSYLLKVDDDTYVKLDHLLNELVTYDRKLLRKTSEYHINDPLPQLYWGYFNGRANIKTKGQWKETNYYLANRYITYAIGGGYVISKKLCDFIANNSQQLTPYVSEDVSMGTWLAPLRNVYRRHDIRFDTGYMPRKCQRYHFVLHKRTTEQMHDLNNNKLCPFEDEKEKQMAKPNEYYYDWYKTADKCCDNNVAL